jgi:hypothetical protein
LTLDERYGDFLVGNFIADHDAQALALSDDATA